MDHDLLKAATSGDSMSMKHYACHNLGILLGKTPYRNTCLHISSLHGHKGFCMDVVALDDSLLSLQNLDGETPLVTAVRSGHITVASVLLGCYRARQLSEAIMKKDKDGCNALHHAIRSGHTELALELIGAEPALSKDVNNFDDSPMFVAVMRNFTDVALRLLEIADSAHGGHYGYNALHAASFELMQNEVIMLMLRADPLGATSVYNLHAHTMQIMTDASRMDAKSLTQTYTSNTSLVAILITTITFAAAFTLPGGYSSASGSEGLPIMSRKAAFQAFLISDTLAMSSSFIVAFICILARWKDYEFLIYYRSFTRKLMWFAYVATTTAFSTGLYTVLAPHLPWLAIVICVLVALLPISTWFLGKWPILKLRFRLGKSFRSDLLDMV